MLSPTRRRLLLAGLAAAASPLVRTNSALARQNSPDHPSANRAPSVGKIMVKGVPVHYEIHGSGKPVIMLHGFSIDSRSLIGAFEPIFANKSGWRRIYFDMPGMGQTPASDAIASADDLLDLILGFIDAMIPGERFTLIGQSYGGYLARGVLARKADKIDGMSLICPVVVPERSKRDLPPHTVVKKDDALLATLSPADADAFAPNFVVQTASTWRRFRDDLLPAIRIANQAALEKLQQHYALSFNVDDLSEAFTKPVLLLTGHQDSDVGYRDQWKLLQNYPRATFAVLDGAGHALFIEQPGLLGKLTDEWLDRLDAASSATT